MKTWTEINFDLLEKAKNKFADDAEAETIKKYQADCDILQKYLNNEIKFEDLSNDLQQKIKGTSSISRKDIERFMSEPAPTDPLSKYMDSLIEKYSKEPPTIKDWRHSID